MRVPAWFFTILLVAACVTPDDGPEVSSTGQAVQWQQGELKVLVLMAEFELNVAHETVVGWAVEQMDELDNYIRAASYDRAWIEPVFRGPYLLSAQDCHPVGWDGFNDEKILRETALLADPTVDFSEFDVVIVLSKDQALCRSGNSGDSPGSGSYQGTVPTAEPITGGWLRTQLGPTAPGVHATFAHELGHVLTAQHVYAYRCVDPQGTPITIAHSPAQGTCTVELDARINSEPMNLGVRYSHYSAAHKQKLGWLDPTNEVISSRGGVYTLTPLSEPGGIKLIEVPLLGSQHVSYTLEYRQPTGYDAGSHPEGPNPLAGVFLHVKWGDGSGDWQLEAVDTPPFETGGPIELTALPLATPRPGGGYVPSYIDAAQNIAIFVYSMPSSGAVVGIWPRTNFALGNNGGTVYAPSQWSASYAKSFANNGTRFAGWWGGWWQLGSAANVSGGCWSPSTWMYVGFGGVRTINQVDVIGLQDDFGASSEPYLGQTSTRYGLRHFHVQYWAPWFAWVDLPGGYITSNNQVWKRLTFPPVNTQYVRVLIECAQDNYARVVELEAHGW